jgi:hypothetical protein
MVKLRCCMEAGFGEIILFCVTAQVWSRSPHCWSFYITVRHTYQVRRLWTSDPLVIQSATYRTQTQETDIRALSRIWTRSSSNRAAANLRLGPRSHLDWLLYLLAALVLPELLQSGNGRGDYVAEWWKPVVMFRIIWVISNNLLLKTRRHWLVSFNRQSTKFCELVGP